jgi:hypothetical protein
MKQFLKNKKQLSNLFVKRNTFDYFSKGKSTSFILESQLKEIERNLQLPLISSQIR